MKKCRFCFPLSKKNKSLLLGQTKNFYLIPSIGPIIEGYLLLCTKKHYSSCENLPPKLYPEFISLKEKVKNIFNTDFGGYTFFEHGKTKGCGQNGDSAHCFHTHLHALPTSIEILPILTDKLGKGTKISGFQEIQNILEDEPYLYYETNNTLYLWKAPKNLRQQFFRSILAEQLGVPERASWKENPNWEETKGTYQKLSVYFNR